MTTLGLLEWARGPGLKAAVTVFVVGTCWRLVSLLLRRHTPELSPKRPGAPTALVGALRTILGHSWPKPAFREHALAPTVVAYTFHLGLLIIFVGGTPHILFLGDFLGFRWPGLPKGVIDVASGMTLAALLYALWLRCSDRVKRRLSNFDDYFTWLVTTLPVVTGLLATSGLGARYETLLAWHVLSFELLLVWFPFGKLMHALLWPFSRGTTGVRYSHRGARV